jgi:hypothetical protein
VTYDVVLHVIPRNERTERLYLAKGGHLRWPEALVRTATVGELTIEPQRCDLEMAVSEDLMRQLWPRVQAASLSNKAASSEGVRYVRGGGGGSAAMNKVSKFFSFHPLSTHEAHMPLGDLNAYRMSQYLQHAATSAGVLTPLSRRGVGELLRFPFDILRDAPGGNQHCDGKEGILAETSPLPPQLDVTSSAQHQVPPAIPANVAKPTSKELRDTCRDEESSRWERDSRVDDVIHQAFSRDLRPTSGDSNTKSLKNSSRGRSGGSIAPFDESSEPDTIPPSVASSPPEEKNGRQFTTSTSSVLTNPQPPEDVSRIRATRLANAANLRRRQGLMSGIITAVFKLILLSYLVWPIISMSIAAYNIHAGLMAALVTCSLTMPALFVLAAAPWSNPHLTWLTYKRVPPRALDRLREMRRHALARRALRPPRPRRGESACRDEFREAWDREDGCVKQGNAPQQSVKAPGANKDDVLVMSFGGGGIHASSTAKIIHRLSKAFQGIDTGAVDLFAGTSAGSMAAAMLASDFTVDEYLEVANTVSSYGLALTMRDFAGMGLSSPLHRTDNMDGIVAVLFGDDRIGELKTGLAVTMTKIADDTVSHRPDVAHNVESEEIDETSFRFYDPASTSS